MGIKNPQEQISIVEDAVPSDIAVRKAPLLGGAVEHSLTVVIRNTPNPLNIFIIYFSFTFIPTPVFKGVSSSSFRSPVTSTSTSPNPPNTEV